jgi:nitrate/nitrite transporter NarK
MRTSLWRGILGAVVGYVIFAAPATLMFNLMGWDPHAPASTTVIVATTLVGIVAAAAGGWVAARIARARWPGAVTAGMIAAGAVISLLASPRDGAIWSQLVAILLMAPAALLASRRWRAASG